MYKDFIKQEKEKAKETFDKLHSLYERKNLLYKLISKHKSKLLLYNFPFHYIDRLQNEEVKGLNFLVLDSHLEDSTEDLVLMANIKTYMTLCNYTIPATHKRLKYHTLNSHMSIINFRRFIDSINKEISNYILMGFKYTLPHIKSNIKIYKFSRDHNNKVIDWGETNKARKIDPTAKIYRVDDHYLAPMLSKNPKATSKARVYKFKFTSYINTRERKQLVYYDNVKSIEEVIRDNKIGNLEKMLAIKHIKGINYYN